MRWTPLNFGRHEGKTLPQVLFVDPDWFFWAYENGILTKVLPEESEEIYEKARSIRVPQSGGEKKVVEYVIHKPTGKFGTIELIPESRPHHQGSSPTFRSNVIDLSIPRQIASYDKFGGKVLISVLKLILFGNGKYNMTKRRCEEFFENDENFSV